MGKKELHCGRCDGTNLKVFHSSRLGDLAPPWWKERDYECLDCGNMVYTYEAPARKLSNGGRIPAKYGIVDNGYVEEVEYDESDPAEDRMYVRCSECGEPVLDEEDAFLKPESNQILHTECEP